VTGLDVAAACSIGGGRYWLLVANTGDDKQLELDLSAWNVPEGAVAVVEEVSQLRHGEVRRILPVPRSRKVSLEQPAQSVSLITIPETPPISRVTLGATDDALVKAGGNASKNYGTSPNLYAKNQPATAGARNVSFIKFDLGQLGTAGIDQAVLRVFGENQGSDPTVIAHVYGLASDQWSESTITWNNAPNLGATQNLGQVNDISQNFIEDVGGTATVLGHFTGTQTPGELMLDVTSFVKDHPDKQLTFLVAREVRFDGENVDDALTSLKLASKERDASLGPQLLLSLNEPPGDATPRDPPAR